MLTGYYPSTTGVYSTSGAQNALPLEFALLPGMLRDRAGYRTAAVGKWHLGFMSEADLPERRGFDSFFGFLNGGEDHYSRVGAGAPGCDRVFDFWDSRRRGPATDDPSAFGRYSAELYGEAAANAIRDHDAAEPLFLYAAFQVAHSPLEVPPAKYFDAYADAALCANASAKGFACARPGADAPYRVPNHDCGCDRLIVAAMITALDAAVANMTTALASKKTMSDDFVLVYSGDNGGPEIEGHWNGGLRGGKWTWFEGGVRPAAFVHSPLLTRRGWHNGTLHLVDWLPTFLALAGAARDDDAFDGVDQWASLAFGAAPAREATLIGPGVLVQGNYKLYAVPPAGFGECEVFDAATWDCTLGRRGQPLAAPADVEADGNASRCPRLQCSAGPFDDPADAWLCSAPCSLDKPCLYDVVSDPAEARDVASRFPDVVAAMAAALRNHTIRPPYPMVPDTNGSRCRAWNGTWGGFLGPWLGAIS